MAAIPFFSKAMLFLCLIAFFQVSFATSKPTGLSMKLIRRDSLYPGNLTKVERIKRLLQLSEFRAQYLDSVLRPNATADLDTVRVPIGRVPDNHLYVVELKIGSRLHPVKLLMDTGSGLIWTQCRPCKKCFRQQLPMYDSRTSTSYHKLPCTHPLCQGDHKRYKCYNNECVYSVRYGVDSRPNPPTTKGVASFESFQFPVDNIHTRVIDDMVFGCSKDNQNFDFSNGEISGILGLSLAPDSLATQFASKGITSYRFSYCLVPFSDELVRPSVLRFGDDIPPPVGNLQTTQILPNGFYHYHLELLDISVGWYRLGFQEQPGIFRVREDGSGGCLIDSGSLISTIDQNTIGRNAYKAVMRAFQAYYDSNNFQRIGKVVESLPLCYRSKPGFKDYMTMTLHFNGADYDIDGKYMHYFSEEDGFFCVALRPASRTILGSWQQQNMRIIINMDVAGLQWVTETCADDIP
ncbi:PREDICTED: aspartic proteinase nepenthesin-2 [Theobroma cacao]|uniref:Aspartic proteinase nepenthesin-2 n=1 Tax=Theobroma cacao TaxID=3641 RepID=A0AB32UXS7_THECC|nr:PREDICTED: aspartic proteinase nepenthesin-2 [Theobroma cacao]